MKKVTTTLNKDKKSSIKTNKNVSAEKYFRRYLRIGPLALALWRAVEARHLAEIHLKKPILDIGCGFGEFAVAYAEEPIDMGIDNNSRDLYYAAKTNKYKNLTLADARDLPFIDNSYSSIFSISTLEHIPNSDKVLREAFRVLKPGGIIFLTLETDEVDDSTFYRPYLKKIGMRRMSDFLSNKYNTWFHRHILLPKSDWKIKMEKAGFVIDKFEDIITPEVNRLFDLWLPTAWPSMIPKLFVGRRVVFRPKFMEDYLTKKYLKYIDEKEKEGTNLLIVAHKPLK